MKYLNIGGFKLLTQKLNIHKIGLIMFSIILISFSCSQQFQSFGSGSFSTATKQLNPSKPTLKTLDDKQPIQAIALGLDSMRSQNKSFKRIESLKILKGQIQELKSKNTTLLKSITNPIAQIKSIVSKQKYQKKNNDGEGMISGVKIGFIIAIIGVLIFSIAVLSASKGGGGDLGAAIIELFGALITLVGLLVALISALVN